MGDGIWTVGWHDMFALGLPWIEKIARPIIVYMLLIIGIRLAGKRELAQLNPFDLIVILMISNTVQNAIIGDDNSVTGGVLGAATLLLVNYGVVRFLYRYPKLQDALTGKDTPLIEHGKLLEANMRREVVTVEEITAAAHKQGFGSISDVDHAVLESDGFISFFGKSPTDDETRHAELMQEIKALREAVAVLQQKS